MNNKKRLLIIALLTKLGYNVTELSYSNRLDHYYTVTKDNFEFSLLLNSKIIFMTVHELDENNAKCSYGLLLDGNNIAHGKEHPSYKTLVDLSWEFRNLLNIQIPTIIL